MNKKKTIEDYITIREEELPGLAGGGTVLHAGFSFKVHAGLTSIVLAKKGTDIKGEIYKQLKSKIKHELYEMLGIIDTGR